MTSKAKQDEPTCMLWRLNPAIEFCTADRQQIYQIIYFWLET